MMVTDVEGRVDRGGGKLPDRSTRQAADGQARQASVPDQGLRPGLTAVQSWARPARPALAPGAPIVPRALPGCSWAGALAFLLAGHGWAGWLAHQRLVVEPHAIGSPDKALATGRPWWLGG